MGTHTIIVGGKEVNILCESSDLPAAIRIMNSYYDNPEVKRQADDWRALKSVPKDSHFMDYKA